MRTAGDKGWAFTARLGEIMQVWRTRGLRASLERGGWQLLAVIAALYLVRDLALYVLLPLGVLELLR